MTRNHTYHFPNLAKNSIFARPITSSPVTTTLPPSVVRSDLTEVLVTSSDDAVSDVLGGVLLNVELQPVEEAAARFHHDNLYVAMSALQKTIRLGEFELAYAACSWMLNNGHGVACWRRLRTIAVEDIGAADPPLVVLVLWLAEKLSLRANHRPGGFESLVISLMCQAVKSRDMADIAYWATLLGSIEHLMADFSGARSSELSAIASDKGQTFQIRHAAARALFPARFGALQPWKRRLPIDRAALYEALGMPPALAVAIERDVAFGGDVLTSAGPIAWALLKSSHTISAGPDPLEPAKTEPLINGVLASSFDRHTRLGRSVLATMLRTYRPWVEFFSRHKRATPLDCVMRGLFYIEGGILRPRLSYDLSDELYWAILQAKFASTGVPSMEEGGWELLDLVREALPEINTRRRHVAGGPPDQRGRAYG